MGDNVGERRRLLPVTVVSGVFFCMVSSVIGARIGFIQRYKLIKKVKTGRGARPDDGKLTFKCILNKRDFEFHIVC